MRTFSIATLCLALALGAAACDSDSPGAPPSDNFTDPTFRATLSPANEVPPVTNAEAGASGTMDITINTTRDTAGTILTASASFSGTLTGFSPGTVITAAHIHTGAAGSNGGPIVNLGLSPGEITLANGSGTVTKNNIGMTVAQANSIIANPAGFYFNAHTALNPGGAVRGQLVATN